MVLKILIIAIFLCGFLMTACFDAKPTRYSIAESKTYEASLFRQNCSICHGPEAEGKTLQDGRVVPNLRQGDFKYKTDQQIYSHISDGGNGMVPFKNMLTPREINMLVDLVQKELRSQNHLR
jgi:mono/diheme cytochrome c family protein